jgi:hypothetical protein
MKERYTVLPMCFYVEGELFESKLRLNLFQVEGYVETTFSYSDDDGIPVESEGTKIFTKSGYEYDILMPVKEFEKLMG